MKQISVGPQGQFTLTTVDAKTGKVGDAVTVQASKALENKALGQIVSATIKAATTRRDAWLSLLGLVFAQPRLDGFKGQGDKTTGKVSKEFKAAVRDAEGETIRALVEDGSIKLPKGDPETMMQQFLSGLRDDKNYSNVKVTANRYFALVGANVVTSSGYLMPVEVMQAEITAVCDKPATDNSVASKLRAVLELLDEISSDDVIDSLSLCNTLRSKLEELRDKNAEIATNNPVNATAVAAAAIAQAQGSASEEPALTIPSVPAGKLAKPGFSERLAGKRESVPAPF